MHGYGNLTDEICDYNNISDSLDYVMRGKRRKRSRYGKMILRNRFEIIKNCQEILRNGKFKITRYYQRTIKEREKERRIQSVNLITRIMLNAVMKIVEERVHKTLIADTAASIKGRGMHYLHERMRNAMLKYPKLTAYTYKCDIRKCYESLPQDKVLEVVNHYIKDPIIRDVLKEAITMLPKGLSIGLRTSQCCCNLYLSHYFDHIIKDKYGFQFYWRYCDDMIIMVENKYQLTKAIRIIHECADAAGVSIKNNEQIFRTTSRPIDFLGYKTYSNGNVRLRRRNKQRFARLWHRVRSINRRKELIGAFYGITKRAKTKHLFMKLTGMTMKQFSELGLSYERKDGKKFFDVPYHSLGDLANCTMQILDYIENADTKNGKRTVVLYKLDGVEGKYITSSDEMLQYVRKAKQIGELPFETTIKKKSIGQGKHKYIFT